ncbi:MAG: hypothetical protein SFZ23_03030 [Planctomycetota bacterium]|nr:hypothetical protein [Planctomycetota bacterium]
MNAINLLPAHRIVRQARRRRRRLWTGIVIAYALATGLGAGSYWLANRTAADLTAELASLVRESAETKAAWARSSALLQQKRQRLAAGSVAGRHADWSLLLAYLAQARGDQIVYETIDIQPRATATNPASPGSPLTPGFSILLEGWSVSPLVAQEFAVRLEQSALFDRVTLVENKTGERQGLAAAMFRVACDLDGSRVPTLAEVPDAKP